MYSDNSFGSLAYAKEAQCAGSIANIPYTPPTVRQSIEMRVAQHESQLAALKDVLKQLDAIPNVETLLDSMRKVGI